LSGGFVDTESALSQFLAKLPGWGVGAVTVLLVSGALGLFVVRVRRRPPSVLRELMLLVTFGLVLGALCLPLVLVPAGSAWRSRLAMTALVSAVTILVYGTGRLFVAGIRAWSQRSEAIRSARGTLELIAKIGCLVVGAMVLMDAFHLSITPFLTTLGIGSLAVALALQETLANFFAGLYLAADRPVRIGDYVKLENGDEGYVESIGWRSTRLRTLPNNTVIIPNDRLAKSVITNYDLPSRPTSLLLKVSVSYGEDSRRVERLLIEVATRAVGKIDGLVGDPAPFVRFIPGFGPTALEFTLICQIAHHVDQYLVQHELRHRILERFREEGIRSPLPESIIHVRQPGRRNLEDATDPGNGSEGGFPEAGQPVERETSAP
jgi:small-conductance mechanosensitive channel